MTRELLIVLFVIAVLFAVVKWWPYEDKDAGPPPDAMLNVTTIPEEPAGEDI